MDINLLSPHRLDRLRELVADATRIVICCHKSPDGDALGSSLAWAEYLHSQGKDATVVVPDAYPDFLQWLPNAEGIIRYDKYPERAAGLLSAADLIFCLDFNTTSRVGDMQAVLDASPAQKILFDHHLSPDIKTVMRVSEKKLSSTSEIVFRIVWQLGAFDAMSKQFAICLYCGMMTDTGAFTYNSSDAEIYYIISQLLTKKFDKDLIYRKVYNNYSASCIRMRGYMMYEKLQVFPNEHAAYFTITKDDMARFQFVKGDAEGLVNEPLRIKKMRMSISLREDSEKENLVWVSLRSVGPWHCNKIAETFFNGGGHPNAAGGHLHCTIQEAEKIARDAIQHFAKINDPSPKS